jgi:hypothetical protein
VALAATQSVGQRNRSFLVPFFKKELLSREVAMLEPFMQGGGARLYSAALGGIGFSGMFDVKNPCRLPKSC